MQKRTRYLTRATAIAATLLILQAQAVAGANRFAVAKNMNNTISIELSNEDAVAGAQFSVNARGGIALRTFDATKRLTVAGVGVYQFPKDESTLNVVLVAPVRSSLPAGEGAIGNISFVSGVTAGADSVRVFLTNVVLCDVDAQKLETTSSQLAWSLVDVASEPQCPFTLEHNYPNPFNPSTTIAFTLEKPAHVRLKIYDIAGQMVSLLLDQDQGSGCHTVQWNVENNRSFHLASGMYFARLEVGGDVAVIKMILTK